MEVVDLSPGNVALALLVIIVVSVTLRIRNSLNAVGHMPGFRVPFYPLSLPGAAIPNTWWNPGLNFPWLLRSSVYKQFGENFSYLALYGGPPTIYTSNMDVARQVNGGGSRTSFIKPIEASQALMVWGMNLIAAESDVWRRHRRVMGPAFNNNLNSLVWEATRATYHAMIKADFQKDEVEFSPIQDITFKLALNIIAECGFGLKFSWDAPPVDANGEMTIQEALTVVTESQLFIINAPKWAWKLPFEGIQKIVAAHTVVDAFMKQQIHERKARVRSEMELGEAGASDVFSVLVRANKSEGEKLSLNDEELAGNVFGLLVAGQETTAHTLSATLGLLASHPEIQEELLAQILAVVGRDRDPGFEDYSALNKVLAVFYEALRLFPAGSLMIRKATEDTVLDIPNPHGEEGSTPLPFPQGAYVVVDMIGVQYNPRYFPDPHAFKPSRWYEGSNIEEYTAFSVGPRACIGRKFATSEAVCWLTLLIRDWKIEPIMEKEETVEQWSTKVLQAGQGLTLAVSSVPIRLVRRSVV